GEFGEFRPILRELIFPLPACFAAPAAKSGLEVLVHCRRNEKLGVSRPTVRLLHKFYLFFAERLAMRSTRILTMRRAISDMTIDDYDRWSARRAHGVPKGPLDSIKIVGITHTNHVPSVGQEPPSDILGERDIRLAFDGDVVVVVDPAQVVELEVSRQRRGLARNAFHHATVAAQGVDPIAEQFKAWFVVSCREPLFGDCHS